MLSRQRNMSASDWINLLSAIFAGIAVLLPFLFKRLEKRDRLSRVNYMIELLKARQELNQLLEGDNITLVSSDIKSEAIKTLEKVDTELATPTEIDRYGFFIATAFIESVLFLGAAFTQLSEWYRSLFIGKAYESGLFFLEGIFGYPAARIFLLVVSIILAVVVSLKAVPWLSKSLRSYYKLNFALLSIFNSSLIIIVFLFGIILAITDPISPLW